MGAAGLLFPLLLVIVGSSAATAAHEHDEEEKQRRLKSVAFLMKGEYKTRNVVTRLEGKDAGLGAEEISFLAAQGRSDAEAQRDAEILAAEEEKKRKAEAAAAAEAAAEAAEEALRLERLQKKQQAAEDAAASQARIKKSLRAKARLNLYAKKPGIPANRDYPLYYIKPTASPNFCITRKGGKKSEEMFLSVCGGSDKQLFYFDPTSSYIQPKGSSTRCLDVARNRNDEPLVLSTCDLAARPFQKWEFAGNGSSLVNSDTHKCLTKGAGGEQPAGKGDDDGGGLKLEIQKCLGAGDWHERQQHWSWVPIREYPGYHLDGRTFD